MYKQVLVVRKDLRMGVGNLTGTINTSENI